MPAQAIDKLQVLCHNSVLRAFMIQYSEPQPGLIYFDDKTVKDRLAVRKSLFSLWEIITERPTALQIISEHQELIALRVRRLLMDDRFLDHSEVRDYLVKLPASSVYDISDHVQEEKTRKYYQDHLLSQLEIKSSDLKLSSELHFRIRTITDQAYIDLSPKYFLRFNEYFQIELFKLFSQFVEKQDYEKVATLIGVYYNNEFNLAADLNWLYQQCRGDQSERLDNTFLRVLQALQIKTPSRVGYFFDQLNRAGVRF